MARVDASNSSYDHSAAAYLEIGLFLQVMKLEGMLDSGCYRSSHMIQERKPLSRNKVRARVQEYLDVERKLLAIAAEALIVR